MFDRHVIVSTDDPQVARSRVSETFCEHELQIGDASARFQLVHSGMALGDIGLHFMTYGARVRIAPASLLDFALVQIPLQGEAVDLIDGVRVNTHSRMGSIAGPGVELEMEWARGTTKLVLYIAKSTLEDAVFAMTGHPPEGEVRLSPEVDFTRPAHRSWFGLVRSLADGVQHDSPWTGNSLVAARIADAVILGLVANHWQVPARQLHPSQEAAAVETVVAMLEESPDRQWRMVDLARPANMSARALSSAFQKKMNTTPMGYLQHLRLQGARRDLYSAMPGRTTVTEVATRWGFAHLSRFAALYRSAFGELPSETLRR